VERPAEEDGSLEYRLAQSKLHQNCAASQGVTEG
jgi:hypothetical protein